MRSRRAAWLVGFVVFVAVACGGKTALEDVGTVEIGSGGGDASVAAKRPPVLALPPRGEDACVPRSCADLGAECGDIDDGCGRILSCGACGGADGGRCGPGGPCCPLTCEQLGIECGGAGDGCGGVLSCGACPSGQGCGYGRGRGRCGPLPFVDAGEE